MHSYLHVVTVNVYYPSTVTMYSYLHVVTVNVYYPSAVTVYSYLIPTITIDSRLLLSIILRPSNCESYLHVVAISYCYCLLSFLPNCVFLPRGYCYCLLPFHQVTVYYYLHIVTITVYYPYAVNVAMALSFVGWIHGGALEPDAAESRHLNASLTTKGTHMLVKFYSKW